MLCDSIYRYIQRFIVTLFHMPGFENHIVYLTFASTDVHFFHMPRLACFGNLKLVIALVFLYISYTTCV